MLDSRYSCALQHQRFTDQMRSTAYSIRLSTWSVALIAQLLNKNVALQQKDLTMIPFNPLLLVSDAS
jgi:hypothetical protein